MSIISWQGNACATPLRFTDPTAGQAPPARSRWFAAKSPGRRSKAPATGTPLTGHRVDAEVTGVSIAQNETSVWFCGHHKSPQCLVSGPQMRLPQDTVIRYFLSCFFKIAMELVNPTTLADHPLLYYRCKEYLHNLYTHYPLYIYIYIISSGSRLQP